VIRSTLIRCWSVVAVTIIVIALLVSSARLLLPYLDTFHQQIEATISDAVGATVEVTSIDAAWHGAGPQLKLIGVRVLSDDETELLHFESGSVGLNLLQSIRHRALQIGNLVVSGVELMITRDELGKIRVAGFAADASQGGSDEDQALLRWLFSQPRMAIESSDVTWRDLKRGGRELHFSNVAFGLRNQGDRHQLDGAAELPIHLGRTLSFALDIEGDPQSEQGWSAQGYIEGGELQLAQWLEGQLPVGVRVDDGQVETRLWLEWQDAVLQRAEGELSLQRLLLMPIVVADEVDTREQMHIDLVAGNYAWQRTSDGWSLTIDDFLFEHEKRVWPASQLSVAMSDWVDDARVIEARFDYARIDDLNALLAMSNVIDDARRKQLSAFSPTGELRDGYLHLRQSAGEENQGRFQYLIASRFDGVGIHPVGKLPGGSSLDGRVRVANDGGYLALDSLNASVSIPRLFRGPLAVTSLEGDLYWQLTDDEWRIESHALKLKNSDAELSLGLALKKGESVPQIALLAEFSAASVANISHYLPVGIMPGASVEWLDRAIVDGNVSAGQMIFYGPLDRRFPYEDSDGLFDVRFNLTDGILDYAPGWPRLEEMEAEVIFAGSGMQINAVAARSLAAEVIQMSARIESFRARPALLEIDGKAQGHARDTLDFVRRSPLNERFGTFAAGVEVTSGRSELDLSLKLPLAKQPAKVDGVVHFEAADFYLADRAVDIVDVNGDLHFSEKGIEIEQAQARLLGMDSVLRAKTLPPAKGGDTIITAQGYAKAVDVRRLLSNPLLQQLDGKTAWQAQLTIPSAGAEKEGMPLRVTSNLKGMAAALPYPLGKNVEQSEGLVLEMTFPLALDVPVTLQYGPQLNGIFDVDEALSIQRGAISLGGAAPVMPEKALLSVGGKLDQFSLEEWVPLIEAAQSGENKRKTSGGASVEIGQLDLEIEQMSAFGYDFYYTSLALESTGASGVWQGNISNHLMGGELQIPTDFARDSLVMALDYLILPPLVEDESVDAGKMGDNDINPQRLPAMNINSRYFSYADQPLGSLKLLTAKRDAGLHVEQLALTSPLMDLSMRGDWVLANEAQHSSFTITIKSEDLGEMLSSLDVADSIREGQSEIGIIARWPGAPTAFALERLSGNMHLKVEDGRLLEVEPGAGRVFGLISLQSLPRRLTLDFSDMFKKGFSFDRMEGDFEINNGDATTTNFSVVGPSASITMTGRVGLATKDYDQDVIVEPHVASSLPVVGAVVGSLGIGAAILLAQKLLNLDEVAQVRYSVKGSWDAPVVTREKVTVLDSGAEK